MKAWSNTAGSPLAWASRSHLSRNLAIPRITAMSPPRAGRKYAVLVGSEPLLSISKGCCGCWKRSRPRSLSGLKQTTWAPRLTASRSGSSMRGWLVPGF
ncbi:hypothetical protein D9M71_470040 [compost metagenome]